MTEGALCTGCERHWYDADSGSCPNCFPRSRTARSYAVENAAKADAALTAALVRGEPESAAYWRGYRVALEALLDQIDRRVIGGVR